MPGGESVIQVRGLKRSFKGAQALKGVDLDVYPGELLGVVGPDGSGKTTLLQAVCAILDPVEGSVSVRGFDTVKDSDRITSVIGYMSQDYSLYEDLTVDENLEFFARIRLLPKEVYSARKRELLDFAGLSPFLHRKTRYLSGGMKKKLALCSNLIHEPDVLVLDEPTLGVDPVSRRHLWRMIEEYRKKGKAVVVATSYNEDAARCDRVAFLLDGNVIETTRPGDPGVDLDKVYTDQVKTVPWSREFPFEAKPAKGEAIRVSGLTKRFGDFTAVDGVGFTLERGEVFAFLGPNGSGKSTTIKMLCGLMPPSGGEAVVAGVDVVKYPGRVSGRIGYMAQRFSLYLDLTVEENIDFFGRVYGLDWEALGERKRWVVDSSGLGGKEKTLAADLSGAVRQRLALGCGILHNPEVLFLDEPTSGVDPVTRGAFWGMIKRLASSGMTVFVTTHYMGEAENCARVAFINRGRILKTGEPGELKARYGKGSIEEVFLEVMEAEP